ncbi:hypothetical protein FBZ83_1101 [Azospirillum brasilense]|uniref:Uncharacterized protein n=1 Tax=Azospirillum brasilense TaxID=192 RepID=A0A560C3J8_AZOBR|nr:hypothetical protein [Azospirillum brasilense]TWA79433.1 hypothetical protein FBZ83_1101 [Azospirillum brasilense]
MPADDPSTPQTSPLGGALITPKDLHAITEAQEMARRKEAQELEKKRQEEQTAIHDAFMHQHIRPDAKERFTRAVRTAAERGETEIEIVRFPRSRP